MRHKQMALVLSAAAGLAIEAGLVGGLRHLERARSRERIRLRLREIQAEQPPRPVHTPRGRHSMDASPS